MRSLHPGDEITVDVPRLSGRTRPLRAVIIRITPTHIDLWHPDGLHAARPEWVRTRHRKHLLPTPAGLIERSNP